MRSLLPDSSCLKVQQVAFDDDGVVITVDAVADTSCCPLCGQASDRIHSRYTRTLADLPWHGKPVRLQLAVRRFFCVTAGCPRVIFAERLPSVVKAHARSTDRLEETQRLIALALGGEAGARLASPLGMPTSPDTLLRRLRGLKEASRLPIRVLGVDDWAWRKGQRYGTILCDLERRRVVDLLPERSVESLRAWLEGHPQIEIVTRDRADDYIKAIAAGAPQALQVADRWHLLRNMRDALMRAIDRHHVRIRDTAQTLAPVDEQASHLTIEADFAEPALKSLVTSARYEQSQNRRARRLLQYETIKQLYRQGMSYRAIGQRLGLHRSTVRRYVEAKSFPERAVACRQRRTSPFHEYLRQRWNEGCHNAARLTQELVAMGFRGSYYGVQRQLQRWRPPSVDKVPGVPKGRRLRLAKPSPRRLAWLLLMKEDERKPHEQAFAAALEERSPEVKMAAALAGQFRDMVRQRNAEAWDDWLARARAPNAPAQIRTFAKSLHKDEAAVKAALALQWSNGQVEGQVNRLKTLKRQMYGRAGFELLRRRVLWAA